MKGKEKIRLLDEQTYHRFYKISALTTHLKLTYIHTQGWAGIVSMETI